jgi:multiple sugar transport system substrate-binding protein
MPILESWYTDQELTDKWINNENFPEHDMYKSAVVDYARDNSKSAAWYHINGTEEFNSTLTMALSYIWNGDKTAQEALDEYYDELNEIYEEYNK